MNETLYNGIVLPQPWPPRNVDPNSRDPLPVPYLEHPPEVIPIDLGRQLLVDDFLISETTLKRRFGRPKIHPSSPVLVPATPHELDGGQCPTAAPFNDGLWYDPADRLYKLWYLSGWMSTPALATSADGFEWERPELDVEPGTNLVWPTSPTYERDGCAVWLDLHAADPGQRYKMFQFYRNGEDRVDLGEEGWLQTSPDGIHWSRPVVTTHVGDNTSFFHNPFRGKWCMSVRRGYEATDADGRTYYHRMRAYTESDDFLDGAVWNRDRDEVLWQRADRADLPDPTRPDHPVALYDLNVTPYESLLIGLFAIFRGPENDICQVEGVPKLMDLELGYSRDGFHFSRPDRTPFLASSRRIGDWNRAYLHAAGGLCVVVGDELRFYFAGFSGDSPTLGPGQAGDRGINRYRMYAGASTGLATLRRDGFAAMAAGDEAGSLVTRPLSFSGAHLFVNAACADGELRVEILDERGKVVPGYAATDCLPLAGDSTRHRMAWRGDASLARLAGRPLRFRFHLCRGALYAFWVSGSLRGGSSGYVAAGGPDFDGPTDARSD